MIKILFVSMPSIHVTRWLENLYDSEHKLYWFDILDRGELTIDSSVNQITEWKKRKRSYIKGEYFLSKKTPKLYHKIRKFLELTIDEKFEQLINEIQPDIVHSFEMQSCSYPIFSVLKRYPNIKWIYSCWGSDLYHYKNNKNHLHNIKKVLSRIDFLHTDCLRDYNIAKELGFKGEYTGVIPGGGGFKIQEYKKYKLPLKDRNILLIKGYEHKFGRALNVIKAIKSIDNSLLASYNIEVFGTHQIVIDYIEKNKLNIKFYRRHELSHKDLVKLMGRSKIYIGNSVSDGMPNTLLEALLMGVFPIQSNPGGATEEIIQNGKNGLLINNSEDINHIAIMIKKALLDKKMITSAEKINYEILQKRLSFFNFKEKILNLY